LLIFKFKIFFFIFNNNFIKQEHKIINKINTKEQKWNFYLI